MGLRVRRHHESIFVVALLRVRPRHQFAAREQQPDAHEHQEENHQEWLDSVEILGAKFLNAARTRCADSPSDTDTERADETDQVQHAPRPEPGHQGNTGVEQHEIAEKQHVFPATARSQDGRGKAAERRRAGQRPGILHDRQRHRRHGQQHHQPEGQRRRQQRMQMNGGVTRQIQHADARALQHQSIRGVLQAQTPA